MERINITAGDCLQEILVKKYPGPLFIPFREAMIKGEYHAPLFSEEFVKERAATHNVTVDDYLEKIGVFMELLKNPNKYDEVILWFGDEPFCQANKKVIIDALLQYGYKGLILSHIVDENTGDIIE